MTSSLSAQPVRPACAPGPVLGQRAGRPTGAVKRAIARARPCCASGPGPGATGLSRADGAHGRSVSTSSAPPHRRRSLIRLHNRDPPPTSSLRRVHTGGVCQADGRRARGGGVDEQRFAAFYAGAFDRLLGQLFLVTGDLHEAEDIVQEAFARAAARWSRLSHYDVPEAWVRRVAINLVADGRRRQRRRVALRRLGAPP